jgi:hypothetical protein
MDRSKLAVGLGAAGRLLNHRLAGGGARSGYRQAERRRYSHAGTHAEHGQEPHQDRSGTYVRDGSFPEHPMRPGVILYARPQARRSRRHLEHFSGTLQVYGYATFHHLDDTEASRRANVGRTIWKADYPQ